MMNNLQPKDIADLMPRDALGIDEIGFSVPERYNASAIFHNLFASGEWPSGTRN